METIYKHLTQKDTFAVVNEDREAARVFAFETERENLVIPKAFVQDSNDWELYKETASPGDIVLRVWPSGFSIGVLLSGKAGRNPYNTQFVKLDPDEEPEYFLPLEDFHQDGGVRTYEIYGTTRYQHIQIHSDLRVKSVDVDNGKIRTIERLSSNEEYTQNQDTDITITKYRAAITITARRDLTTEREDQSKERSILRRVDVRWNEQAVAETLKKLTECFEHDIKFDETEGACIPTERSADVLKDIIQNVLRKKDCITEITDESKRLVSNAIKTPDGTVLQSNHVHDYKTYKDANGETYMVDGGTQYTRRSINEEPFEELSVYDNAPWSIVREKLKWGTRGKDGRQPVKYVSLAEMDTDHIKAILDDGYKSVRRVMLRELLERGIIYYDESKA